VSRDKEHSTIIYESPQPDTPLLRLGWNKQDPRYMATLLMDCSKVVVLDIRYRFLAQLNLLICICKMQIHRTTASHCGFALVYVMLYTVAYEILLVLCQKQCWD